MITLIIIVIIIKTVRIIMAVIEITAIQIIMKLILTIKIEKVLIMMMAVMIRMTMIMMIIMTRDKDKTVYNNDNNIRENFENRKIINLFFFCRSLGMVMERSQ